MKCSYWRRPDGTIYKADDGRHAPTALLDELGRHATIKADGTVSWPINKWIDNELAVASSISIIQPDGSELNETDSSEIVDEAVIDVIKKLGGQKPISPKALLKRVDQLAAGYFMHPAQDRLVATSLSIADCSVLPIDVFGTRVSLERVSKPTK